jgi:hypothetical protein
MPMRLKTRLTGYLVAVFVCAGTLPVGGSELEFSVKLHAPAEPVKSGEEVRLRASVVNVCDHDVKFARPLGLQDEEIDYAIEIRDAHGQQPAITPFYRKLKAMNYGFQSYMTYVLEPGKSFDDELVITRLYSITAPGEYTIRVARGVRPAWQLLGNDDANKLVKSNTIVVRVTP